MSKENGSIARRLARFMAFLLLVLGHVVPAAAAAPEYGGTVTMGVDADFRGFDPLKARFLGIGDRSAIMAVEERLFDMDSKGKLIPELALSAKAAKDNKSWTIALRKGVTFHDGTPFNADAVVEHWQRLLDPNNRFFGLSFIQPIQSVQKINDFSVKFILKHPWAPFKQTISSPVGILAYIPSPKAVREGTQDRAPVGTGPFIFKEWKANDRLVVVRNPKYWQKGKPYLDSVTFRPMPDMQARFASLQSGETDVIRTDRGNSIQQAYEDKSLKVYKSDAGGAYPFVFNTSKPPLNDVRVRQALAHAFNQELLVKLVYKDTLPIAKDPFGNTLSCGDTGYREYNPEKARKLLAQYGKPVELELFHTTTPRGKEAGEIIQRLYKDVGVTVKLVPVTEGQMAKRVMESDFQFSGWRFMDFGDMGPFLKNILHSGSPLNYMKYSNPKMDELLDRQNASLDPVVRKKALCEVAKLVNDDAVFFYGGGMRFHIIAKTAVQGITGAEHGIVKMSDVWVKGNGKKVAVR
ncbi:MAG: 4-phytase / acid [Geobacteraceae bacterium]|nr:MAG: 4-phytase / acid [Geobacteraceae bacterium]